MSRRPEIPPENGTEPAEVVKFALVEREHALVQVPVQVEGADADVGAMQAALERLQKFSMTLVWTRPSTYAWRDRQCGGRSPGRGRVRRQRIGVDRSHPARRGHGRSSGASGASTSSTTWARTLPPRSTMPSTTVLFSCRVAVPRPDLPPAPCACSAPCHRCTSRQPRPRPLNSRRCRICIASRIRWSMNHADF